MQNLVNQAIRSTENFKSRNYEAYKEISLVELRSDVAEYFELTLEKFTSSSRLAVRAKARAFFSYYCYEYLPNYSDSVVGQLINRHRTNVIHLVKKIKEAKTYDPVLWTEYKNFCLYLEVEKKY